MMKNLEYCKYTYRHRKAFSYLVDKLIRNEKTKNEMIKRARFHDLDKMTLYLFLDKKQASFYHKETPSHHLENNLPKTHYDYLEAIVDFECAGYTKPDKPLNAYDTVSKMYKNKIDENTYNSLMNILKKYNLDSSYSVLNDKYGVEFMKKYENVTEEMILYEVLDYTSHFAKNSFLKLQMKISEKINNDEGIFINANYTILGQELLKYREVHKI